MLDPTLAEFDFSFRTETGLDTVFVLIQHPMSCHAMGKLLPRICMQANILGANHGPPHHTVHERQKCLIIPAKLQTIFTCHPVHTYKRWSQQKQNHVPLSSVPLGCKNPSSALRARKAAMVDQVTRALWYISPTAATCTILSEASSW